MKTNLILLLTTLLSFGFSCKKDETVAATSQDFACDKTTKIKSQTFGDLGIVFEYSNGKLLKMYRADNKGLIENYNFKSATELLITRNFADGGIANTFNITLNDKGFFAKFVTDGYNMIFTYDANGYLINDETIYTNPSQIYSNTYSYTNNNRTQVLSYTNKVLSYTQDITYYEDKLNKADYFSNQNRPDMYGKFSKNLVKALKFTYPDKKFELYEYTYDLNTNGFIKSSTEKYTDKDGKITTLVNKFEYVCL